jgi:hypothetical protein
MISDPLADSKSTVYADSYRISISDLGPSDDRDAFS